MLVLPLRVHKRAVEKFKRAAKESFPKENFGFLLGQANKDFEISHIWIPEDIGKFTTKDTIFLQDTWVPQVLEYCEDHELTPLGSIHSHPYSYTELTLKGGRVITPDHATSEADALVGLTTKLHGVCRVLESKNGRLTATVRFWGPEVPVVTTYVL